MKIVFEFTEQEMQNPEVIRETILSLFNNQITNKEIVNKEPTKKTKEERIKELEEFANKTSPTLTEPQKKSLKRFVAFYTDKINQQDFNINPEKQFQMWWERDKNNK